MVANWERPYAARKANNDAMNTLILNNLPVIVEKMLQNDNERTENLLVHGTDSHGQPHLETAAYEGNPEIVRIFLRYGADVNRKNEDDGGTALQSAAKLAYANTGGGTKGWRCFQICKILLENGADPLIVNNYGETALDLLIGAASAYSAPEAAFGRVQDLLEAAMAAVQNAPGEKAINNMCNMNRYDEDEKAFTDPITMAPLDPKEEILVTDDGYCFDGEALREWYKGQGKPINPMNRKISNPSRLTNCLVPLDFNPRTGIEK